MTDAGDSGSVGFTGSVGGSVDGSVGGVVGSVGGSVGSAIVGSEGSVTGSVGSVIGSMGFVGAGVVSVSFSVGFSYVGRLSGSFLQEHNDRIINIQTNKHTILFIISPPKAICVFVSLPSLLLSYHIPICFSTRYNC